MQPTRESDILHMSISGRYYVARVPKGYELRRHADSWTHSVVVGRYGRGPKFLARAIADADKRDGFENSQAGEE